MVAPAQQSQQQSQLIPLTLAQAAIPRADQERKECMKEAWKAYRGEFQAPLKVEANQPNDNVISNRCAPIVDKGTSFLFGQVLKIEASDEAADDEDDATQGSANEEDTSSPIQDFLDGLWGDDDDRMTLLSNMGINGGVCGEVFVKLIPAQRQMKYPRIVVMDPLLVRIMTAPDDCSLTLAYVIEYPGVADFQKRQVIARVDPDGMAGIAGEYDLDDTWTITNYLRKGNAGSWYQAGEQEQWPYPFAPIFCCQNLPNPNESWGTPDLTPDLIDQNKVLNFIQSNISRIVKYHGHPLTYATGLAASQISIAVDELICLPSENSKLERLAPMDNFSGLLAFVEDIRSNMDEQSRVPAVALGRESSLPKGNLSGVALQLLFQPLMEKTVQKQRLYGKLIREVSRAALICSGKIALEDYEDYPIGIHWPNLLPIDDTAAAQTALLLSQLGVSKATLMQELGYDADTEADKNAAEDARTLTQFSRGQGFPPANPAQQQQQGQESPFLGTPQGQGGQQQQ